MRKLLVEDQLGARDGPVICRSLSSNIISRIATKDLAFVLMARQCVGTLLLSCEHFPRVKARTSFTVSP
jgi:hypothetical protein